MELDNLSKKITAKIKSVGVRKVMSRNCLHISIVLSQIVRRGSKLLFVEAELALTDLLPNITRETCGRNFATSVIGNVVKDIEEFSSAKKEI